VGLATVCCLQTLSCKHEAIVTLRDTQSIEVRLQCQCACQAANIARLAQALHRLVAAKDKTVRA
jgi:hypothetical protein